MVTLEQVKLLDQRITRTIDFVKKVSGENALLKGKQNSYKKRIAELEKLIQQFKDDQGQIEEKFLSAFNRLNEIEDALGTAFNGDAPTALDKTEDVPAAEPEGRSSPSVPAAASEMRDPSPAPAEPDMPEMYVTPETHEPQETQNPDIELDIF